MMDQLLERDGGPPHVIADVLETSVDETHHDSQVQVTFVIVGSYPNNILITPNFNFY